MIKINLLPIRAAQKRELIRFQLTVAGLFTFLIMSLFTIFYAIQATELNGVGKDISQVNQELKKVKKQIGELDKIKVQKKRIIEKLNIVKKLEAKRTGPVELFGRFEEALPNKAWISNISDKKDSIVINGYAATEEIAGDFVRSLQDTELFESVELPTVTSGKQGNYQVYKYNIKIRKLPQE